MRSIGYLSYWLFTFLRATLIKMPGGLVLTNGWMGQLNGSPLNSLKELL